MKDLISVIIPTYNLSTYVAKTVESALSQSYQPIEIIVCDDGSQDNTYNILKPWFKSIKYIYQDNLGGGFARSTAIKSSAGKFIALLDADDIWLPNKLSVQMEFLSKFRDVALVGTDAIQIDHHGKIISNNPIYPGEKTGYISLEKIILNSPLTASSLLMRRECISPNWLDKLYTNFADWDLCLHIAASHHVGYIAEPLVLKRIHENQMTKSIVKQDIIDLRLDHRLSILDIFFNQLSEELDHLTGIRPKAEALEYAYAAIPGYINDALDISRDRLAKALHLDSKTWSSEKLNELILHYFNLLTLERGEEQSIKFLELLLSNLPAELKLTIRNKNSIYSRAQIALAFHHYRRSEFNDVLPHVIKGIVKKPSSLYNRGVISISIRSLIPTLRKNFLIKNI